jgi:hypothetical protein
LRRCGARLREELNLTEYIRAILIAREKPAHDAHAQVS